MLLLQNPLKKDLREYIFENSFEKGQRPNQIYLGTHSQIIFFKRE